MRKFLNPKASLKNLRRRRFRRESSISPKNIITYDSLEETNNESKFFRER